MNTTRPTSSHQCLQLSHQYMQGPGESPTNPTADSEHDPNSYSSSSRYGISFTPYPLKQFKIPRSPLYNRGNLRTHETFRAVCRGTQTQARGTTGRGTAPRAVRSCFLPTYWTKEPSQLGRRTDDCSLKYTFSRDFCFECNVCTRLACGATTDQACSSSY